jgi:hypothetical protein
MSKPIIHKIICEDAQGSEGVLDRESLHKWIDAWLQAPSDCCQLVKSVHEYKAPFLFQPFLQDSSWAAEVALLKEKHGGPWGEHPKHSRSTWGHEADENYTSLGYWEWVAAQIEQDDDDFDDGPEMGSEDTHADNGPYTDYPRD